jgi:hypothetical protein
MKDRERREGWKSVAIAAASIMAAVTCGGCLYTLVPAMAGPSTTYPQPANGQPTNSQPTRASQQSPDQTNQPGQNKQQSGVAPNGAQA